MLKTCRLYLIGRILFWLHLLFLQFYRTVVCLSCITDCICWRWPYSYFVSWWILWVCNPIRPPLFGCVLNALWYSFTRHLCHSILATWLAIWFSAEFGYSSPLCVRSLATLNPTLCLSPQQTSAPPRRALGHAMKGFQRLSYRKNGLM